MSSLVLLILTYIIDVALFIFFCNHFLGLQDNWFTHLMFFEMHRLTAIINLVSFFPSSCMEECVLSSSL